jgi:hypothetical protein
VVESSLWGPGPSVFLRFSTGKCEWESVVEDECVSVGEDGDNKFPAPGGDLEGDNQVEAQVGYFGVEGLGVPGFELWK